MRSHTFTSNEQLVIVLEERVAPLISHKLEGILMRFGGCCVFLDGHDGMFQTSAFLLGLPAVSLVVNAFETYFRYRH